MKRYQQIIPCSLLSLGLLLFNQSSFAMGKTDDPILSKTMGEIELLKEGDADVAEWEIDTWIGRDLQKFWIKTEGEYAREDDESEIESAEIEFLYGKAVRANWDVQFGLRTDLEPDEPDGRNWLVFGFKGLAPGFWDVDANFYIGEESSSQLNIEIEREFMLTQRWVLTPEFELTANGRSNPEYGEGSGLESAELSIRLGYETRSRRLQPFVAIEGVQYFGATKNLRQQENEDTSNVSLVLGLHFWF
ncbi:MAG: copper resistance protein B [Arenicella sp.]